MGERQEKIDFYNKMGYTVLTLWETDIHKMNIDGTLTKFLMENFK